MRPRIGGCGRSPRWSAVSATWRMVERTVSRPRAQHGVASERGVLPSAEERRKRAPVEGCSRAHAIGPEEVARAGWPRVIQRGPRARSLSSSATSAAPPAGRLRHAVVIQWWTLVIRAKRSPPSSPRRSTSPYRLERRASGHERALEPSQLLHVARRRNSLGRTCRRVEVRVVHPHRWPPIGVQARPGGSADRCGSRAT